MRHLHAAATLGPVTSSLSGTKAREFYNKIHDALAPNSADTLKRVMIRGHIQPSDNILRAHWLLSSRPPTHTWPGHYNNNNVMLSRALPDGTREVNVICNQNSVNVAAPIKVLVRRYVSLYSSLFEPHDQ